MTVSDRIGKKLARQCNLGVSFIAESLKGLFKSVLGKILSFSEFSRSVGFVGFRGNENKRLVISDKLTIIITKYVQNYPQKLLGRNRSETSTNGM